jgi:polyribonucleotide nucleotidyltransferase
VKVRVEKQIGDLTLSFESGQLARQAAASILAQYGETMVLTAMVTAPSRGLDFLPLTCDYRERFAATGKFPGGFLKREGRPTTREVLISRLMDRPVRPNFPHWFKDEVQVLANVLSYDKANDPDLLAINSASAALWCSELPFYSPIGTVRVGRIDDQWKVFPSQEELEESEIDLIVSGNRDSILMIEGFAREMPEDLMYEALMFAHKSLLPIIDMQEELANKLGVQRKTISDPAESEFHHPLRQRYWQDLAGAKTVPGKHDRAEAVKAVNERAKSELLGGGEVSEDRALDFKKTWHDFELEVVRRGILEGKRSDGRDSKTLRPIECHVDVLPRTHGSAIFQRGETQALITVTLGTGRDEQRVDGLMEEYSKKFMLDYNFPSYSVGEVRPIRGPGRREIGHGALAERSVNPVIPSPEEFPYTIRVISDILESNGSSSMASVCGATLGLMAAGVPILNPVAGISIGLVKESDTDWTLLTDIIGEEDHYGDMDFKVAGTQNGITGIQLDLKIRGIHAEIVKATLGQARDARIQILRKMLMTIREPKTDISGHAPRLKRLKIDVDKIGALIGPGGKHIRGIQEQTGTIIEVNDEGIVTVASSNMESMAAAVARIEALTQTVQIGKIYDGRVASIRDFGAFVEILPGKDGLVHISELSNNYVGSVMDVCKVGDEMKVLVLDVDEHDRVKLSRKRALEELGVEDDFQGTTAESAAARPPRSEGDEGGGGGGRDRGPRGGGGGGRGPRGGGGGGRR